MLPWHWILGIGLGIIAAVLTTNAALEYSQPPNRTKQKQTKRKQKESEWNPNKNCPICIEELGDEKKIQYLSCCHGLHEGCLKKLKEYSKVCPFCRAPMEKPIENQ